MSHAVGYGAVVSVADRSVEVAAVVLSILYQPSQQHWADQMRPPSIRFVMYLMY